MSDTNINTSYRIWCDGSCYHTSEENSWMGMGVYMIEENDLMPLPVVRKLAIAGPKGNHNWAEYLAIICALTDVYILEGGLKSKPVREFEMADIIVHSDSQLVIRQITGKYQVKKKKLLVLNEVVLELVELLSSMHVDIKFKWNPRTATNQKIADHLSKVGNPYFKYINDETVTHHVLSLEDILLSPSYKRLQKTFNWEWIH